MILHCTFAAALGDWRGVIEIELPAGACVADALVAAREQLISRGREASMAASGRYDDLWSKAAVGIFGQVCERTRLLAEGDRIELYLPLQVDPKAARRERARERQTDKGRNPLTVSGAAPGSRPPRR